MSRCYHDLRWSCHDLNTEHCLHGDESLSSSRNRGPGKSHSFTRAEFAGSDSNQNRVCARLSLQMLINRIRCTSARFRASACSTLKLLVSAVWWWINVISVAGCCNRKERSISFDFRRNNRLLVAVVAFYRCRLIPWHPCVNSFLMLLLLSCIWYSLKYIRQKMMCIYSYVSTRARLSIVGKIVQGKIVQDCPLLTLYSINQGRLLSSWNVVMSTPYQLTVNV